jgi:hypothetical protein
VMDSANPDGAAINNNNGPSRLRQETIADPLPRDPDRFQAGQTLQSEAAGVKAFN